MNESKRRYVLYATTEKLKLVNPVNKEHIKRYFISKSKNLSEASIKGYLSDFNQWLVYILENHDNKDILKMNTEDSVDMIEDFLAFCTTLLGNNERRIQRRFSSISSFYSMLKQRRKIKDNPIDFLDRLKISKGEKTQLKQTFLTKSQIKNIRRGLKQISETQLELFFEFGLSTMAKANDMINVRIDQIDFNCKRVEMIEDNYEVILFPSDKCISLIQKWIKERKKQGIENEHLFITKYGGIYNSVKKVTLQTSWIKKVGRIIDLQELSLTDLRHSGANLLFKEGLPLEIVSKLLNHKVFVVDQIHVPDYDKIQEEKSKILI